MASTTVVSAGSSASPNHCCLVGQPKLLLFFQLAQAVPLLLSLLLQQLFGQWTA